MIVFDGVIWQFPEAASFAGGFWSRIFQEWIRAERADGFTVLARGDKTPPLPDGVFFSQIPLYTYPEANADRTGLQTACDQLKANIFVSTYYTTPLTTPTVACVYDMLPERSGHDLTLPQWQEKRTAILHASEYLCLSDWVAADLRRFYPGIAESAISVIYPGLDPGLQPVMPLSLVEFRKRHEIEKPYSLYLATGEDAATVSLLLQAVADLPADKQIDIAYVVVEGISVVDADLPKHDRLKRLTILPAELASAYSGAVALIQLDLDQRLFLPQLEAMRCGCPIIWLNHDQDPLSYPYLLRVDQDPQRLVEALIQVQNLGKRNKLTNQGLALSQQCRWEVAAQRIWETLQRVPVQLAMR